MFIYGLAQRLSGQPLYYTAQETLSPGDQVVIVWEQGTHIAKVITQPLEEVPEQDIASLPSIVRLATDEDLVSLAQNADLEREAFAFCRQCIGERNLDMKLVDVEAFFDRSKLLFYFTAPSRIDFRELVRDLVRRFHTRIELRQIGVRHETQMVGAVGNCGMVCCCRRFLRKFEPVTIRMAKEQNLFLNPSKISGSCGRLLCCLAYEQDGYDAFYRNCPKLGKKYKTTKGEMRVLRANMFRNSLAVINEDNEEVELTLDEWQALEPRRSEGGARPAANQGQSRTKRQDGAEG